MRFVILILFPVLAISQGPNDTFLSWKSEANVISISSNEGMYKIGSYFEGSVDVEFIRSNNDLVPESHAVVAQKMQNPFEILDTPEALLLYQDRLTLKILKSDLSFTYFFNEQLMVKHQHGFQKTGNGHKVDLVIGDDDILYGGGARALGMNRRGQRLRLYNKANYGYEVQSSLMNFCMPVVLSSKKFIVHFDNPSTGFLDLDSQQKNIISFEAEGGRQSYQVIFSDNWPSLMKGYVQLTGTQPLPPIWSFGNFASRFGYHSQKEVLSIADKFRESDIPLDAIIMDLYWFGRDIKGTMGNLRFYADSFPEPKKMISQLSERKIQTVLITEPFLLTTSDRWQEAKDFVAKDSVGNPMTFNFYFGNTGLLDLYRSDTRHWFWGIYKELHDLGVRGIWGDLGEPEVHPDDIRHAGLSANLVHNIYGHDWARMIKEGYSKDYPFERPFILMRSGYSGSQRFGMIPWSGDVNRSWGGLKSQPEIALQMGMQGLAYMHSDLGGFAGDYDDPELYTRWLQYGVFQPVFRPHSQEQVASEPIFKDQQTLFLTKKAIELRYRLLPYNYSIAYENTTTGLPLMRPTFFVSEDPNLLQSCDTYLWGPSFLIAPILEKQQKHKEIYLPSGSNWIDYYSDSLYQGGENYAVTLCSDHIPVFVRGGSFVVTSSPMKNTTDLAVSDIEIHLYYDSSKHESAFVWYEDDGITNGSDTNTNYMKCYLSQNCSDGHLQISIVTDKGTSFTYQHKSVSFVLHGYHRRSLILNDKRIKLRDKNRGNIHKFSVNEFFTDKKCPRQR
jgi:oligosaccharide 4-alpha-D-glucosyltransferase